MYAKNAENESISIKSLVGASFSGTVPHCSGFVVLLENGLSGLLFLTVPMRGGSFNLW